MLSLITSVAFFGGAAAIGGLQCRGIWDPQACNCMVSEGDNGNTVCEWDTTNHVCDTVATPSAPDAVCTEAGTHVCSDVTDPLTCACTEGCLWASGVENGVAFDRCYDGAGAADDTLTGALSFPLFIPDVTPRVPSYVCRCRTLHTGSQHTGPEESCHHQYPTDVDLLLADLTDPGYGALVIANLDVDNNGAPSAGATSAQGAIPKELPNTAQAAAIKGCSLEDRVLVAGAGTTELNIGVGTPGAPSGANGFVGINWCADRGGNDDSVITSCKTVGHGCCTITRARQTLDQESLPFFGGGNTVSNVGSGAAMPTAAGPTTWFLDPRNGPDRYVQRSTANGGANGQQIDLFATTAALNDFKIKVDPTPNNFVNPFTVDVFFNNDYREIANPFSGAPMAYGCAGGAPILAAPALASANAITFDDGVQFFAGIRGDVAAGTDYVPAASDNGLSFGTPYTNINGAANLGVADAYTNAFRFPTAGSGTGRWKFLSGQTTRVAEAGNPASFELLAVDQVAVGGIDDGFGLVADNFPGVDDDNAGDIGCQCGYHRQTADSAISADAFDLPPFRTGARPLASTASPNGWTCTSDSACASGRCEFGGGLAGKVCVPSNWADPFADFHDEPFCFPAKSTVRTGLSATVPMSELQINDLVEVALPDGTIALERVIAFLDKKEDVQASYIRVDWSAQGTSGTLRLSPKHVAYKGASAAAAVPVFADELRVGDNLVVRSDKATITATVTNVAAEAHKGAYAPLTASGNIIVDDVHVSSYANFKFPAAANVALKPLQMYHSLYSLFSTEKYLPEEGVHPFASVLSVLGKATGALQ